MGVAGTDRGIVPDSKRGSPADKRRRARGEHRGRIRTPRLGHRPFRFERIHAAAIRRMRRRRRRALATSAFSSFGSAVSSAARTGMWKLCPIYMTVDPMYMTVDPMCISVDPGVVRPDWLRSRSRCVGVSGRWAWWAPPGRRGKSTRRRASIVLGVPGLSARTAR